MIKKGLAAIGCRTCRQSSVTVDQQERQLKPAVNPVEMFHFYSKAAKEASCPTCRTVNMLGMMCAAAMKSNGIFAFVGKGYGSDWPNPWEQGQAQARPERS
jgi:hypothetical protein